MIVSTKRLGDVNNIGIIENTFDDGVVYSSANIHGVDLDSVEVERVNLSDGTEYLCVYGRDKNGNKLEVTFFGE